MRSMSQRERRGLSSVFGVILFLLLVLTLASTLFLSLYWFEGQAKESIALEEARVQEKIVLLSISTENVSGTEYITGILVNNTGTITSRIRAVYIDGDFICDPSDSTLNPDDTYVNPKDSLWIQVPNDLQYKPLSKIEVATERGVKTVEYQWRLKSGSQAEPPSEAERVSFGPLLLDFEKFYYTENYGSYDPYSWKPGWSVEKGTTLVWNVTVTNIDDRDLTINKYSGFTLVSNDGGVQKPWYIEPPNGLDTLLIPSNTTVHLIYIWDRPRLTQGASNQSVYNQNDRSKVFLTFFGIFHELDGSTKPYGQTIPFEAVLVRDPQIVISASPTVIAAGSTMTSTITVMVRDVMGLIAPNVPVTFTSTLGTPSFYTTATNSAGIATFVLSPGLTLGTALITATAQGTSRSVSVSIATGILSLSASPSTVAANSTMTSTITARITLNNRALPGETVTFTIDAPPALGTLYSPTIGTTDTQGYVTVTFTPGTDLGTATITAAWATLSQSVSVVVTSGTLTLSTPNPSAIAASSSMTSTITARVTLNSNPLPGETVVFTTNATSTLGTFSTPSIVTTDAQGYASVTFVPGTDVGTAMITAEWGAITESTSLSVVAASLSLSASPSLVAAGSSMSSTVTAVLFLDGATVGEALLSFATDLGYLSSGTAITNSGGEAIVTLLPGVVAGDATVSVAWEGLSDSVLVAIGTGVVSVQANVTLIVVNSTETAEINATITLNGNPVVNTMVTFGSSLGTLADTVALTDDFGVATVMLSPGPELGIAEVTATWENLTRQATVEIVEGPP